MNETILVVDESRATLMLAEKTLSAAGYNVRVATMRATRSNSSKDSIRSSS